MYYRVETHQNTRTVCEDDCESDHWRGFYASGSVWDTLLSDDDKTDIFELSARYPTSSPSSRRDDSGRHWFTEYGWFRVERFRGIIDRYDWLRLRTTNTLEVIYKDKYQVIGK